ncbi:MAG TPA: alpha/beta fold hydrolase [Usitatibacter sp.]
MSHPPLAPGHIDAPHRIAALGDLALESGEAIPDFRQSYVTHGELDAARSNAILVCTAITGTHHRLDFLIGPGKALDTRRHFVIATDAIGNGLSTSPSNSTLQPRMRFPRFTIRDMVSAQHRLVVEHLGIERLHAVVGASMGGMQALQWAVSHPALVGRVVAMTPMAAASPWSRLVLATARACLMADPAWTGDGFSRRPDRGWAAYAGLMNGLAMRTPSIAADGDFDAMVAAVGAQGFDAHDFLYQSWAYEAHDVGGTPGFAGDTRRALASIRAPALVFAPPLDLLNPEGCAREAADAIPGGRFIEIPTRNGHMGATSLSRGDADFLDRRIAGFLRGE